MLHLLLRVVQILSLLVLRRIVVREPPRACEDAVRSGAERVSVTAAGEERDALWGEVVDGGTTHLTVDAVLLLEEWAHLTCEVFRFM